MSSKHVSANEYVVRVPKNSSKKYSVMRFGGGDMMDIQKWTGASMSRDMSAKKIYQEEEELPEFGAGSEYGRKQKEEARKLKYGLRASKFNIDDQPWNLKIDTRVKAPYSSKNRDKDATVSVTKEFVGRKEGGIGEGSMYFVFMQTPDRTFEAYPVDSWYNFSRKIKHRTLTDEEAEAEWDKRDKILNHLNFMARKRLQIDEENEEDGDDDDKKKKTKASSKIKKESDSLLIHDEDKLVMSDSDDSSDEEVAKKKKTKKQKDLKHDAPEEGVEDSDDGDGEGMEQDYNSDISSEEETVNDSRVAPKGLDEQESSSSSEEEEEKPENDPNTRKTDKKGSGDDMSSSGDSEIDSDLEKDSPALLMTDNKTAVKSKKGTGSNSNSRSSTPVAEVMAKEVVKKLEAGGRSSPKVSALLGKRHATEDASTSNIKRVKTGSGSGSNTPTKDLLQPQNVLNEETVRRYLQHKPITPKDLLKKFKTKKTGLKVDQIVNTVAAILKKLEPEQKKINGKMHLFLKQS